MEMLLTNFLMIPYRILSIRAYKYHTCFGAYKFSFSDTDCFTTKGVDANQYYLDTKNNLLL